MEKEFCKTLCDSLDIRSCASKSCSSDWNCCLECMVAHNGETKIGPITCQCWDNDKLFKFVLLKTKYKKAEEKKMESKCPSCNGELFMTYKVNHPVFGDRPYAHCPFCGWTEEEGDNYKPSTKEGTQLRMEGM